MQATRLADAGWLPSLCSRISQAAVSDQSLIDKQTKMDDTP